MGDSGSSSQETNSNSGSDSPKPASKLEQVVKKLHTEKLNSQSGGSSSETSSNAPHSPQQIKSPDPLDIDEPQTPTSLLSTRLPVLVPNPLAAKPPQLQTPTTPFMPYFGNDIPTFPKFPQMMPSEKFGCNYPGLQTPTVFHHNNHRPGGNLTVKNLIALQYGATLGPNRMSYPREFKLMVVKYYYENGMNKYRTCKTFQITKSMLNGWLAKLDKIEKSRPGSLKSGNSGRKPQFPQIEQELYQKYKESMDKGQTVGNKWLRDTARAMATENGIPFGNDDMDNSTPPTSCQFSERWLTNFKRRYNIVIPYNNSNQQSMGIKVESPPEPQSPDSSSLSQSTNFCSTPPTKPFEEETSAGGGVIKQVPFAPKPHETIQPYPIAPRAPFQGVTMEPGRRGRKVQFPQVESILYELYLKKQGSGERISNRWLQEEARRLAVQICPEVFMDAYRSSRCMFSEHWLHNFKKRYGISLKNQVYSQSAPQSSIAIVEADKPFSSKSGANISIPLAKTSNVLSSPMLSTNPPQMLNPLELYKQAMTLQYLSAQHGGQQMLANQISAFHILQQVAAANHLAAASAAVSKLDMMNRETSSVISRKNSADAEPDSTDKMEDCKISEEANYQEKPLSPSDPTNSGQTMTCLNVDVEDL